MQQNLDSRQIDGTESGNCHHRFFDGIIRKLEQQEQNQAVKKQGKKQPRHYGNAYSLGFVPGKNRTQERQSHKNQGNQAAYDQHHHPDAVRRIYQKRNSGSHKKSGHHRQRQSEEQTQPNLSSFYGLTQQKLDKFGTVVQINRGKKNGNQGNRKQDYVQNREQSLGRIVFQSERTPGKQGQNLGVSQYNLVF